MTTAQSSTPLAKAEPAPSKPMIELGRRGIELRTIEDLGRFATAIEKSGMAPKGMAQAQIIIAIQMGMELGLTPMAAIQNIAVINGRPTIWGDGMLAVVRGSGLFNDSAFDERFEGEFPKDNYQAICVCARVGSETAHQRVYSIEDAKKAGLWGKSGPWQSYPKRMLQMRARAFALRDVFADVLRGIQAREEVLDYEDAKPAIREPRRVSDSVQEPSSVFTDQPHDPAVGPLPQSDDKDDAGASEQEAPSRAAPAPSDRREELLSRVMNHAKGVARAFTKDIRKQFQLQSGKLLAEDFADFKDSDLLDLLAELEK